MTKHVYWLKEIYRSDIASVGGKAANLGDLARNLNVPAGFCLSSLAYHQNLVHFGIDKIITEKLLAVNMEDLQTIDSLSEEIFEIVTGTPILPEIENAVKLAFSEISTGVNGLKVAVRSSATAEDLVDASFAGLQETYLNIEGIDNILLSIKKCWASLWTPRAIHYRNQKNFVHEQVRMAVIIQEMVPAEASGVMFTANPVSNSREEIRIEAVRGLGEQLVSGHVSGDIYVFKKNEVNVELVSKTVYDEAMGQMINDYDLRELAHIGLKIELYYEDYQDVEWAYHKGEFYFLQTRPITTLSDEKLQEQDSVLMSTLQNEVVDWVAERFPEPIYPIDGIVVKILFDAQFEAMRQFGFTVDEMDWTRVNQGIFPEFFMPPRIKIGLKRLWPYLHLGRTLKTDPAREWAGEQVYLLDTLKKLRGRDISSLPLEVIIDYVSEAVSHFHYFIVMRYRYFAENRIPSLVLTRLLNFLFPGEGVQLCENILAGSDNITLDINRGLRDLAREAQANLTVRQVLTGVPPEEAMEKLQQVEGGQTFLAKYNDFISRFGERETSMGLGGIASPTWQEAPEVVLGIISSFLDDDNTINDNWEEVRKRKVQEAEEKINKRLSEGILSVIRLKPFLNRIINQSRSFTAFRENSHYDITKGMHVFRILFGELGKRFVRRKILQDQGDIFYLTYFEITEIITTIFYGLEELNVKALAVKIKNRKEERERRLARWRMRNICVSVAGTIKGKPSSQGMASGPVRIIKDAREFHRIQKGDILVAPYTNPAWTPLFTITSGIVVETGGASSHAAVIAREYGIPAVMGVIKATEIFTDGEIITINGTSGDIYRSDASILK